VPLSVMLRTSTDSAPDSSERIVRFVTRWWCACDSSPGAASRWQSTQNSVATAAVASTAGAGGGYGDRACGAARGAWGMGL